MLTVKYNTMFIVINIRRILHKPVIPINACGAHISGKIGEGHNPETHLIPIILQAAPGTRDHISIFGTDYPTSDGTCIRDYIHVTDLAQAHILAVEYLMKDGKSDIFNLGNGVGFSVREVIEKAKEVTQKDIKVVEESRRSGDPAVLIASSDKAKTRTALFHCLLIF